MIACTSACFLINFSLVIYDMVCSMIKRIKFWRHQRKMKLKAEKRQRIDEERHKQRLIYHEEQIREQQEHMMSIVVEASIRR